MTSERPASLEPLLGVLAESAINGSVAEWTRASTIREFVQPWYAPLPVNPTTTGIALGGLGNSFTLNPRGRTVALNFLSGAPVLNGADGVELQDFYFSERAADDLALSVASPGKLGMASLFHPLVRSSGEPWWPADADRDEVERRLPEMLVCDELVSHNLERVERWGVPLPVSGESLLELPTTQRNLLLLSHVYASFLRVGSPRQRSLMADEAPRNGLECLPPEAVHYSALFPAVRMDWQPGGDACSIERVSYSPVSPAGDHAALPLTVTRFSISHRAPHDKRVTLLWLGENLNGYQRTKLRPGEQDAAHTLFRTPSNQRNERARVAGLAACHLLTGSPESGVCGTTAMG
ncbi:MAG TPA: hypothetical protein VMG12_15145, partial [Polyangiaceae bacterium]|nr:hypothetical protein [Polyangiaceae bacterium]